MHLFQKYLLTAGPTTGKSTLREKYVKTFPILDTDDLTRDIAPKWFSSGLQASPKDVADSAMAMRDRCMGLLVKQYSEHRKLLISNLWGVQFQAALFDLEEGFRSQPRDNFFSVLVFRKDPLEITRISVTRGGSKIPLKTATSWVKSAKKYGPKVFRKIIWLENDEYLNDVVIPSNLGWTYLR